LRGHTRDGGGKLIPTNMPARQDDSLQQFGDLSWQ